LIELKMVSSLEVEFEKKFLIAFWVDVKEVYSKLPYKAFKVVLSVNIQALY